MEKIKKTILLIFLIFAFTASLFSQNITALRQPASEKAIPELVVEAFKEQYKYHSVKGWYVTHLIYWQNDYSSDWYTDWYHQRNINVYTFEKPNYFEVEFVVNLGELSRAIYNRYGYWYETRTKIKGLPMAIYDSIRNSKYAGWKISPLMEKIESPQWPVDIYRFNLSKGMKSHIIRMEADGTLIQDRYLEEYK